MSQTPIEGKLSSNRLNVFVRRYLILRHLGAGEDQPEARRFTGAERSKLVLDISQAYFLMMEKPDRSHHLEVQDATLGALQKLIDSKLIKRSVIAKTYTVTPEGRAHFAKVSGMLHAYSAGRDWSVLAAKGNLNL